MAEVTPPLVLEGGAHASHLVRQLWGDTYTPGVIGSGHLNVTEQGTPALGVTVAAGRAVVAGSEASDQGVYYVSNGAARDVGLATADATNDRIDLVVARVLDSFYSGADDEWELQAVTGVPAAVPVAPAAPANSLVLAEVEVPADAGGNPAITNAEITDRRTMARHSETLRQVFARVDFRSTNQTIANATNVVVAFNGISFDSDTDLARSAGVYTVNKPGFWRVTAQLAFASNATGNRITRIQKNSLLIGGARTNAVSGGSTWLQATRVVQAIVGDTFDVQAFQNSGVGGGLDIEAGEGTSWVSFEWLGPL